MLSFFGGWFWDCIFDILRYSKIIFHTARVDLRKPWASLLPPGVLLDQQSTITQAHKFGSNQSSVAAISSSHLVLCTYNRRARLIFVLKFDTPANISYRQTTRVWVRLGMRQVHRPCLVSKPLWWQSSMLGLAKVKPPDVCEVVLCLNSMGRERYGLGLNQRRFQVCMDGLILRLSFYECVLMIIYIYKYTYIYKLLL